jgi:hypothetical protein
VAVMNSAVILLARFCSGSQFILRFPIYALSKRQRTEGKAMDTKKGSARESTEPLQRLLVCDRCVATQLVWALAPVALALILASRGE